MQQNVALMAKMLSRWHLHLEMTEMLDFINLHFYTTVCKF